MKILIEEATPLQLDYLVAVCETLQIIHDPMGFGDTSEGGYWVWPDKGEYQKIGRNYSPTKFYEQSGPLLQKHHISLNYGTYGIRADLWFAEKHRNYSAGRDVMSQQYGKDFLIAGMRSYIGSVLQSRFAEVPDNLK